MSEPGPSGVAATHGYLFADLRGYTGLVERRGAVDAGRLLERYRAIVRDVVGRHGGAEVKTEGDSFYIVVPTASAAIRCGLDLVAACGRPPDGGEPIPVGVGIHAGEAVLVDGGFVGSAVNIAARVCAEAGPGQLLATATVRELARSVVDARFVGLGRRALKGIAEPVELYRVATMVPAESVDGRAGQALRVAARPAWIPVVAVLVVVLAGAGGLAILVGRGPGAGPTPSPSPAATPASPVPSGVAGTPAFPDPPEAALLARLPPSIATGCVRGTSPDPAAQADLRCKMPAGVSPTGLVVLRFRDQPITAPARVDRVAADRGLPDGDCAGGVEGHGPWGGGTIATGRIACFFDTVNQYWIEWSYDKDGILAQVAGRRSDAAAIRAWWTANATQLLAPAP